MKALRYVGIVAVAGALLVGETACNSMTNTGKGALIGGGGGAAVGAGIGALIGGGKGAGIGSAIGAAVGAGAGALIGNKMDKQQKQLEEQLANQAKVEQTTDQNGLQAIKVTFDGGILSRQASMPSTLRPRTTSPVLPPTSTTIPAPMSKSMDLPTIPAASR